MYLLRGRGYGAARYDIAPGGQLSIVRRLALTLAFITTLLATSAVQGAGSCSSQSHNPLLSAGKATPGTGTTATVFTFSVTYSDTKGCAPNWVRVTVSGVGVFDMTGSGTSYLTGVTFTHSMKLPAGTYTYRFAANSGDFGARKTTALTTVSPASVTVTVAATTPPPTPTPKPTPKPTPVPTPKPTPVPTPRPTPTAGAATAIPTTAATPVLKPSPHSPAPSIGSGGVVVPSNGATGSQAEGQLPGSSSGEAGSPGSFTKPEEMGSFSLLVGGWAAATAGGLFLFLYLAPRRRQPEPVLAEAAGQEILTTDAPPPAPEPQAEQVLPEEANMPRWLRPSVQAARRGQRGMRSRTKRLEDS